jgi:hypothetical protein
MQVLFVFKPYDNLGWSRWPHGLLRDSAASRLPGLRVQDPLGAWMSVSCEGCVLSGIGLSDGSIPRPEKLYCLCVCVCVLSGIGLSDEPIPRPEKLCVLSGIGLSDGPIPRPEKLYFVCVLSGIGLYDGPIPRPEKLYWVCVIRYMSLWRADPSSREVFCVCVCVIRYRSLRRAYPSSWEVVFCVCVIRYKSLWRADPSSREVFCVCVREYDQVQQYPLRLQRISRRGQTKVGSKKERRNLAANNLKIIASWKKLWHDGWLYSTETCINREYKMPSHNTTNALQFRIFLEITLTLMLTFLHAQFYWQVPYFKGNAALAGPSSITLKT